MRDEHMREDRVKALFGEERWRELKKRGKKAQEPIDKILIMGGYLTKWKPSADGKTVSLSQYLRLLTGGFYKYEPDRLKLYRDFCKYLDSRCPDPFGMSEKYESKLERMRGGGITEETFNQESRDFALWWMERDLEERAKKMKKS